MMRKTVMLCALVAAFSVLSYAKSFQGRLIDATCYDQQKSAANCDPSSTTTAFALVVSNQAYHLDEAGNAKVSEALKNRADRMANPNQTNSNQINAKVEGTMDSSNRLRVDNVTIQ